MHETHPPICPHEECHGRTFKSHQRLKDHLKVHVERETDLAKAVTVEVFTTDDEDVEIHHVKESRREKRRRLSTVDGDKGKGKKLARLLDGEAGKIFSCAEPGCEKKFKTVSQTASPGSPACADRAPRLLLCKLMSKRYTSPSESTSVRTLAAAKHTPTFPTCRDISSHTMLHYPP